MLAVKIHLLVTILCTQAFSVYEGRVPYFPIEISRTAAESARGLLALQAGVFTLIATLQATGTLTNSTSLLWVGLMFVAFCPDTTQPGLHVFGLLIVASACALQVYDKAAADPKANIWVLASPILCAAAIFAFKIALRTVALILVDWQNLPNQSSYPFEGMLALIVRSRRLLFEGEMVYPLPQAYKWAIMKPVLQVCGILQWVTFYALSLVF